MMNAVGLETPTAIMNSHRRTPRTSPQTKEMTPWSMLGGRSLSTGGSYSKDGTKEFAEPVALSSSESADVPLPRIAARLGLDLFALRARRSNLKDTRVGFKGEEERKPAQFAASRRVW